ncbi:MAG: hypothetical protein JWP31_1510 [Aeromicrobium sp.]|nr:hypothetical protein [Aeromicrobium sp.]
MWVETARGTPSWPGLVMEWRQNASGEWEGRVAVLTKGNAHGPYDTLTLHWISAARLRPLT